MLLFGSVRLYFFNILCTASTIGSISLSKWCFLAHITVYVCCHTCLNKWEAHIYYFGVLHQIKEAGQMLNLSPHFVYLHCHFIWQMTVALNQICTRSHFWCFFSMFLSISCTKMFPTGLTCVVLPGIFTAAQARLATHVSILYSSSYF